MAYYFPGEIPPWTDMRFTDVNGVPLALGTVSTFQAGTTTPLETFSDSALSVTNGTVVTLDATGAPPVPMFLLPQAYKFIVKDVNAVVQTHYPLDNIVNVGQLIAEYFGVYASVGSRNVVSGYTTTYGDHFITVNSSGGPNPCLVNLLPASQARWPLTIKNIGNIKVRITPNGLDVLEGVNAFLQIPAAAYPYLPVVTLIPDGSSGWLLQNTGSFSLFV